MPFLKNYLTLRLSSSVPYQCYHILEFLSTMKYVRVTLILNLI